MEGSVEAVAPSVWQRVSWEVRGWPGAARHQIAGWLLRLVVRLIGNGNLMAHARRELPPVDGDEMQDLMNRQLLQIVAVFSMHGHSGFSAGYAVHALEKLLRFEPLRPLTGEPDEWFDHGDGMLQNIRCSHVFKQPDRFNGQAYDIQGRIFRDPDGSCWQNGDSHVPITFPYTPKREYVDVPASQPE